MKTKDDNKKIARRIIFFALFIIVFVWLFVYYSFSYIKTNDVLQLPVPSTFAESKESLSEISKKISEQNKEIAAKIEAIKTAQKNGDKNLALSLVGETEKINNEMRKNSENFMIQLKNLEDSIKDFKNPYLEDIAIQAINVEKDLMQEFGSYTLLIDEFLKNLASNISNPNFQNQQKIQQIISQLNEKINKINDLNAKFNQNIQILSIK